jgi:hypothetical protein
VLVDDRAFAFVMPIERDAVALSGQQIGQDTLAFLERCTAQILTVELDEIEGAEHGRMIVAPGAQQIEGGEAALVDHDGQEHSAGCMHGSRGQSKPASPHLISEPKMVAEMAKATVAPNPLVPWDEWVSDYSKVRDAIAKTYPDIFHDFNARMWQPGGFHRPLGARHRKWETKTGKANFIVPAGLETHIETPQSRSQ